MCVRLQQNAMESASKNERNSEKSRINGHLGVLGKQVENNNRSASVSPYEIWESSHLYLSGFCAKSK